MQLRACSAATVFRHVHYHILKIVGNAKHVSGNVRDVGEKRRVLERCWRVVGECWRVLVSVGVNTRYSTQGTATMAAMVGTLDATNQLAKVISTPRSATNATPTGFAAMAVSHSAEDKPRPAILLSIR